MVTVSASFHGFGIQMLSGDCKNVITGEAIEHLPATAEGLKEVSCQKCQKNFT